MNYFQSQKLLCYQTTMKELLLCHDCSDLIKLYSLLYNEQMCVCFLSACSQDVSKEPIVEVRIEEEATANHDAEGHPEPNETTPLTEPE